MRGSKDELHKNIKKRLPKSGSLDFLAENHFNKLIITNL